MAHPDPRREGSEKCQRDHSGPTSEASDAGLQDKSQSHAGTHKPERRNDDVSQAPESGEKPEVMRPQASSSQQSPSSPSSSEQSQSSLRGIIITKNGTAFSSVGSRI